MNIEMQSLKSPPPPTPYDCSSAEISMERSWKFITGYWFVQMIFVKRDFSSQAAERRKRIKNLFSVRPRDYRVPKVAFKVSSIHSCFLPSFLPLILVNQNWILTVVNRLKWYFRQHCPAWMAGKEKPLRSSDICNFVAVPCHRDRFTCFMHIESVGGSAQAIWTTCWNDTGERGRFKRFSSWWGCNSSCYGLAATSSSLFMIFTQSDSECNGPAIASD